MAISNTKLSKNQSLVIESLIHAGQPLGAYAILDALRDKGFSAPPQVYRALNQLLELGLIHRLESLNAYIACQLDTCHSNDNKNTSFVICEGCGMVQELSSSMVADAVAVLVNKCNFVPTKSAIEISGLCHKCIA